MAETIFKSSWTDLIFDRKNKEYGAYDLRKKYDGYIITSLVIAASIFAVALAGPLLYKKFAPQQQIEEDVMLEVDLKDIPPPPPNENEPPPPPPPPVELPKVETIKYLPPVVKPDEEVQEPPPTVEEIKEAVISNKTQEGVKATEEMVVVEETGPAVIEAPREEEAFMVVEEMPTFPGGSVEMMKFIQKELSYPKEAANMGIEGRVIVKFLVNKEGHIQDVQIAKGIGYGCDEEAIRVVKKMPSWSIPKQNGRAAKVWVNLPIKFKLAASN